MGLTTAEQKKIQKIEQELENKKALLASMKAKAAGNFAKYAIKYNLWKLDNKTLQAELKAVAERHKTV